jgi:hypothetical protein
MLKIADTQRQWLHFELRTITGDARAMLRYEARVFDIEALRSEFGSFETVR